MRDFEDAECPRCARPLATLELRAVEIDACLECGGIWLDAGELERIAEMAGGPPGLMTRALKASREGKNSDRRCPRCSRRMRARQVDAGQPVEIDACPKAHGFWFDPGELRKLIEGAAEGEAAHVAAFFDDALGHWMKEQD